MKKYLSLAVLLLGLGLAFPASSFAQGMMGTQGMMGFASSSPDTAAIQSQQQEEQQGKQFLDNLNNKTVTCSQLTDADFEKIGEYFMGQAIGNTARHIAMNDMMTGMMGTQGEEQMHILWGKRGSGCDQGASTSQDMMNGGMMSMMMGGGNYMGGFGTDPMGFGWFGWIFMILLWVLIVVGIVALIRWLMSQSRSNRDYEKSPVEILKERYAKGEIDRKEFEDKKKDLI